VYEPLVLPADMNNPRRKTKQKTQYRQFRSASPTLLLSNTKNHDNRPDILHANTAPDQITNITYTLTIFKEESARRSPMLRASASQGSTKRVTSPGHLR